MRILILSKEAWRDEQNGGNVLSNIFADFEAEFAQIYCSECEPNNHVCKNYYQMTDKMVVENILKGKRIGKVKKYDDFPCAEILETESYSGVKRLNLESVRILREIGWCIASWDKESLITFAEEFQPDVIFAPCYGSHYMIKLTRLIAEAIQVPVISYISDDFYTNRQFRFSPVYWLNHFLLRKRVREVFKIYSLVYTMTEEQKEQCESDFSANMKILRKGGTFSEDRQKKSVGTPIRFIYGGGIYIKRWKTLVLLAEAMRKLNKDGIKTTLDIYTNTKVWSRIQKYLDDGCTSCLHKAVPAGELQELYANSDVALHVEGFDLKSRSTVRLSFSTKIVDCLDSGCAVMAICDSKQAGFAYLKRNDAAICISEINKIKDTLQAILDNPHLVLKYQAKAFELGRREHDSMHIKDMLEKDFQLIINGGEKDEDCPN